MDCFDFPAIINSGECLAFTNRQKVEIIEYWLTKEFDNIADELPVKHHVFPGGYARELFIPAGTMLTGKVHLHPGVFFLAHGDLSVMGDHGMQRIQGPSSHRYSAGIKRVGYAHADSLCVTFHRIDKAEIAEIETELFEDSDLSWIERLNISFPRCERLAA